MLSEEQAEALAEAALGLEQSLHHAVRHECAWPAERAGAALESLRLFDLLHEVADRAEHEAEDHGVVAHTEVDVSFDHLVAHRTQQVGGTVKRRPDVAATGSRASRRGTRRDTATRRRGGRSRAARSNRPGVSRVAGPWMASSTIALSSTERVSGPKQIQWFPSPSCGVRGTRPLCGLRPKTPQQAAGIRIEPAPSTPIAAGTRPAATAAADPPLDPPGVRSTSQGLRVTPQVIDSVNGHSPSSGMVVLPTTIAPASRRRRTTSASAVALAVIAPVPRLVTSPAMSISSLTATGTPSSGAAIAACSALVSAIGVGERSIGEDRAERVEFAVEPLDPSKRQFDQLARRRLATPHELGLSGHTVERHVVLEHRLPTLSAPP